MKYELSKFEFYFKKIYIKTIEINQVTISKLKVENSKSEDVEISIFQYSNPKSPKNQYSTFNIQIQIQNLSTN